MNGILMFCLGGFISAIAFGYPRKQKKFDVERLAKALAFQFHTGSMTGRDLELPKEFIEVAAEATAHFYIPAAKTLIKEIYK